MAKVLCISVQFHTLSAYLFVWHFHHCYEIRPENIRQWFLDLHTHSIVLLQSRGIEDCNHLQLELIIQYNKEYLWSKPFSCIFRHCLTYEHRIDKRRWCLVQFGTLFEECIGPSHSVIISLITTFIACITIT